MKKRIKYVSTVLLIIVVLTCMPLSLMACSLFNGYNSALLEALADDFALMLMGNGAANWNALSVSPEKSFGYVKDGEYSWYAYHKTSKRDIDEVSDAFHLFENEFLKVKYSKLNEAEAVTYRYLDNALHSYMSYYDSPYALDFELIGSSYISSEGGYVADFASTVENYIFRSEEDVKDLLEITKSTKTAFMTYMDYMEDRVDAGYPLWDETVAAMQDYLTSVLEQQDNYYLYKFIRNKINAAECLDDSSKSNYINAFETALTDKFMRGVEVLCAGLDDFRGVIPEREESYLTAYGNAGAAYYQWRFEYQTGIRNANLMSVYNQLVDAVKSSYTKMLNILDKVDSIAPLRPQVAEDFDSYLNEEKALMGLSEPSEILSYLKIAAKSIVPDLQAMPSIQFKYMDATVADRTGTMAYYLKSPIDESNSAEYITLNPHYLQNQPVNLLTTMAHEGYPGHLYAYVNAKESNANLLTAVSDTLAFSEGWAVYASIAVLENIAANTDDEALSLFCQFNACNILAGYAESALYDIEFNYLGYSVKDFLGDGVNEESLREMLDMLKENPAVYIPYGYGSVAVFNIHDKAKKYLGKNYNEVDFNRALLSEGMGPTLTRAEEIADGYISANR